MRDIRISMAEVGGSMIALSGGCVADCPHVDKGLIEAWVGGFASMATEPSIPPPAYPHARSGAAWLDLEKHFVRRTLEVHHKIVAQHLRRPPRAVLVQRSRITRDGRNRKVGRRMGGRSA